MRFMEQPSPTESFCRKCISHGSPMSGSHRGLCPYAGCSCYVCMVTKSQRAAIRKMKRRQSWKIRCPIALPVATVCSGTVTYSSTPLLSTSPKVDDQNNIAAILSNLAANTVLSVEEKCFAKKNNVYPVPIHMLHDARYNFPVQVLTPPSPDVHPKIVSDETDKSYVNCLERNTMVHGYTNLISALYDLYERQSIAAQKWSSCGMATANDDQYQSFLKQVRSREKEMITGVAEKN